MTRLKSSLLGYYVPSFFEMHIDTFQDDLTITSLSPKDRCILFHEYIHFLQDITTYYGLSAIYAHGEYIRSVVTRIYKSHKSSFIVPYEILDNNDNVLLNRQLAKLTQGDDTPIDNLTITKIEEFEDEITIPNKYMDKIPSIILYTGDHMLIFGATAIMENMAYIFERLCEPEHYKKSPDYPYRAAELVAEYFVPNFSGDLLMVIALCDMCLQSSNPGACFVRAMKGIQCKKLQFSKPEEIYDYFYNQCAVKAEDVNKFTFTKNYLSLLKDVENHLKSYLKDIPDVDTYYAWIDRIVKFALFCRIEDKFFMLNMVRSKGIINNDNFCKAIYDIGTPLMSNNHNDYFIIPPNGLKPNLNVEIIKAVREIEKVFESASNACDMYRWCIKSPESNPNELCCSSPWLKSKEEKLCTFALLWRHWNLTAYSPQKNNSN